METQGEVDLTGHEMNLFPNLTNIKLHKNFFQCSLCQKIARSPMECRQCGGMFCEECVKIWRA